jgi:hypothetical protein
VQITHVDGQPVITLPSGQQVHPTAIAPPAGAQPGPNGPNAWSALLPSGDQLTILPDGSTSLQLISTGGTQNWDAAGHFTGGSGPDANGASLPNPSISHDTVVPMDGGGYRVDHPDGSSDIHWPDGRVVHVLPDGAHWVEVPPVKG